MINIDLDHMNLYCMWLNVMYDLSYVTGNMKLHLRETYLKVKVPLCIIMRHVGRPIDYNKNPGVSIFNT